MQVAQWRNALKNPSLIPWSLLARVVTWLLVMSLAWLLGRMFWSVVQPVAPITPWAASSVSSSSSSASQGPNYNLRQLQQMQLFGRYSADAPSAPVERTVIQDAPETKLNLSLVGVVASNSPQTSLAVIANRNQQSTYGIDELIEGTRATLVAVYVDRVIIRNAGRDETLMLDGTKFAAKTAANNSTRSLAQAAPALSEPNEELSEQLSVIKQEVMENPQNIFNYIRLSQVKEDGELKGYRVNPGKDRTLFDAVGLKANDLALTLNGNDLTDPSVMATLFQELQQTTSLSLSVDRDGQLHDIYIDLQ
ncbi:type II secretion system protein GspC [Thaumasiovibrio sp. DFM-14]|uniref:type II secretion system protein GspC n=1 Tax=Thaumasiovibrio sp. DFM-14 TaxID=3384792 RepID=UPI0039A2593C